ncbi:hypothetical protein BCR35DRAFT_4394 [Leucosporidium creatinivorum]|uniref:F-box domain-containing protein n=1 Tax=Leucosporidium creatinivorum TaxID=106004 RepID=A0A1Y2G5G7_9BASI|nr:hypothetical protein BCR35DRAFT_4394 [Leucosporidium creatinivorum]
MHNPLEARSPPSPPPAEVDDEALRPLPSLPTEIWQRIIQLTLPRLSYKTFRERYDTLLVLCRVNKLWAALAQRELYSHVWLNHEVSGTAFLANYSSSLARTTKSLRLNEEHRSSLEGIATALMHDLTGTLPRLTVLPAPSRPLLPLRQIGRRLDTRNRQPPSSGIPRTHTRRKI